SWRIVVYTARAGMPLASYSLIFASDTSAPILRTFSISALENWIASPPASMIAFLPGTSSPSQARPTSASLPVVLSIISFLRAGGQRVQEILVQAEAEARHVGIELGEMLDDAAQLERDADAA